MEHTLSNISIPFTLVFMIREAMVVSATWSHDKDGGNVYVLLAGLL
jgi:hypothetical protein